MKKTTFKILLGVCLLFASISNAQCLVSAEGLYPSATSVATTCNGIAVTSITTLAYASEYSNVQVTAGETYTFSSSNATDYITISDDDGVTAAASGVTPVTWVAVNDGVVRFYTHTDAACGGEQVFRTRSYVCGIAPCTQPVVTFTKDAPDCLTSTFTVTVDITDMGSAASITVTDDQASSPQQVLGAGQLTFGPYPFGTSVVLTATNDQTNVCNVVSDTLTLLSCPPTNDTCDTAVTLNCGDVLTNQSTEGATGGTDTSCVGTIGDDVWYSFTGDGQQITMTATTATEGPQIEVYESTDGTCSGFTAGSCFASAGTGDTTSTVVFNSVLGTVYYIHIGNYINTFPGFLFDLSVSCGAIPPAPVNDDCANAIALNCGDTLTAQTTAAATGGSPTSCVGTIGDDIWYSFAGDGQQNTLVATAVGASDGAQVEVYESTDGTCAGFTPGTCFASAGSGDTTTIVTFTSALGSTYYIHIGNWINGDPAITFDLSLTCGAPPTPPANDDCANAEGLTLEVGTTGTTSGATTVLGLTPSCQTTSANDVWYTAQVPASGALTITVEAAPGTLMTDSVLTVFSGTCGALTELGCNDDNVADLFSTVALTGLTPGDTVLIGVWRYAGGTGVDGEFIVTAKDPFLATPSFNNADFAYYPNPVKNVLNLSYSKNITAVTVFNLLGQEIMTKPVNANLSQIDMSHLSNGTYMVKVTADNQVKTIKVVKQ